MSVLEKPAMPPAAGGLWAALTGDLARKGALALSDQAVQSGVKFLLWVAVYMVVGTLQLPAVRLLAMRCSDAMMLVALVGGGIRAALTIALAARKGPEWAVGSRLAGDLGAPLLAGGCLGYLRRQTDVAPAVAPKKADR